MLKTNRNYLKSCIVGLASIALLLCAPIAHAQETKETVQSLIKKAGDAYNSKNYFSYTIMCRMYRNHQADVASENYQGILLKKNGVYYYKIKDIEFLNFTDSSIKISNSEKAFVIGEAQSPVNPLTSIANLKGFTTKLKQNKQEWICELVPAKLSQMMISKMLVYINKADYSITRQETYFLQGVPKKDAKGKTVMELPKMEVDFVPRPKQPEKDDWLVNKSHYFSMKGTKVILSKKFSAYKLYKS